MNGTSKTLFLIVFLPLSFLLGLFLAPWVFNGLIWLGRNWDVFISLRNVEFERVVSRVVVVTCILGFLTGYRLLSRQSDFHLGWTFEKADAGRLLQSLCMGITAVVALYILGWIVGVFRWHPTGMPFLAGRMTAYIPAVILIAWIEESLFRGILFKGLARSLSWMGAAWISSLLYSLVHFAKPDSPIATVYGHWYSGFQLIPHTFAVPGGLAHIFPYAVMLTFLGLAFSLVTYRTGKLYAAAGLHAGVILGLKIPSFLFVPTGKDLGGIDWFGFSSSVDKSYAAFFGSLILLFWVHKQVKVSNEDNVPRCVNPY